MVNLEIDGRRFVLGPAVEIHGDGIARHRLLYLSDILGPGRRRCSLQFAARQGQCAYGRRGQGREQAGDGGANISTDSEGEYLLKSEHPRSSQRHDE